MISLINGVMTALLLIIFVGIWVWAWSAKNKDKFRVMANLPLDDQPEEPVFEKTVSEESDETIGGASDE